MGRASLWQRPARASALETRDADAELPERAGGREPSRVAGTSHVGVALKSCADRGVAESAGLVENVDVKRLRHTPSFLPIASVFVLRSEKAVAHHIRRSARRGRRRGRSAETPATCMLSTCGYTYQLVDKADFVKPTIRTLGSKVRLAWIIVVDQEVDRPDAVAAQHVVRPEGEVAL